jgi:hypothetical protein
MANSKRLFLKLKNFSYFFYAYKIGFNIGYDHQKIKHPSFMLIKEASKKPLTKCKQALNPYFFWLPVPAATNTNK